MRKILFLTMMISIGLILFTFELFLPQPIPGGRIGLSQIVTLLVLVWYGWQEALMVVLFRVLIGNLILGTLFNPVFVLSFSGAIVSLFAMTIATYSTLNFSIIGISLIGAFFHNLTQLVAAYCLFIRVSDIFWLIPYFIWVSLMSGFVIGSAAWFVHRELHSHIPEI